MKFNLTQLIARSGNEVSLSRVEHEKLERVVTEYMRMKPRRSLEPVRHISMMYAYSRQFVAASLLCALVFSGTGISYAAELALPGDVLYPIKVSVNEEVVAVLTVSAEGRASWDAERAGRRLEEAASLSIRGELTPERREELAVRFERHSERATRDVEEIEIDDAALALDLAQELESKLAAHEELLRDLGEDNGISERIRGKRERISELRVRSEGRFALQPTIPQSAQDARASVSLMSSEASSLSAIDDVDDDDEEGNASRKNASERMKKSAEKGHEKALDAYARVEHKLTDAEKIRVESQLNGALQLIATGDEAFNQLDFTTAFKSYQESATLSQKLAVYLKAGRNIDIRVRSVLLPANDNADDDREDEDDSDSTLLNEAERTLRYEDDNVDSLNDDKGGTRSDSDEVREDD